MKKLTSLSSLLPMALAFGLLPLGARAQGLVTFVESGNTLTETFNGAPIGDWVPETFGGNQAWINVALTGTIFSDVHLAWYEPGDPSELNIIPIATDTGSRVFSDESLALAAATLPLAPIATAQDSALISDALTIILVRTLNGNAPVSIQFIDSGDPKVPDATNTSTLCVLACLSLVVVRRYVTPHPAAA